MSPVALSEPAGSFKEEEPFSKIPIVNHRQPGTAFGNRQEPFSLGVSNRSIRP
jgi:hypothetical protein